MPAEPPTHPILSILLIDDDPTVHAWVKTILDMPPPTNIKLMSALTVNEAMVILLHDKPNIVLLDLNLKETQGVATIEQVLPEIAELVPVVILTGHGNQALWVQAVKNGAMNFLSKEIYLNRHNRGFFLHSLTNAVFMHEAVAIERESIPANAVET